MKKTWIFLLCIGAILFMAACSNQPILAEDFSDPASGWDQFTGDSASTKYREGAYLISVNEPYFDQWALARGDFTNIAIEVDATKMAGPDGNHFGLICNYQDMTHFYMFLISSQGYYMIQKQTPEGYVRLSSDSFEPSDRIKTGIASNTIKAECADGLLRLLVNGRLLNEVEDSDYLCGDLGLLVGTYSEAGVIVSFDTLRVYQLR